MNAPQYGPQYGPMRRVVPVESGPKLSPAEFGLALAELHARPTLQALCDAAAQVGTDALGSTWVAVVARRTPDGPLQSMANAGPGASPWPVAAPSIGAEAAWALFQRLDGKATVAPTVSDALGNAVERGAASALQLAVRPEHVCLAPVVVEGLPVGVVLVLVRGEGVPEEAVLALADHTATATRGQLLMERMRNQGDVDQATFLINRAAFDIYAAREVTRARRYKRPLSLLVLSPADPDDDTLRRLGSDVMAVIRVMDILARLDEGRLALLLPETERAGATTLARRTEQRNPGLRVTVATLPGDGTTWEALLAAAESKVRSLGSAVGASAAFEVAATDAERAAGEATDSGPLDGSTPDAGLQTPDPEDSLLDPHAIARDLSGRGPVPTERFTQQNGPRRSLREAFPSFHQQRNDTGYRFPNGGHT